MNESAPASASAGTETAVGAEALENAATFVAVGTPSDQPEASHDGPFHTVSSVSGAESALRVTLSVVLPVPSS